MPKFLEVTDTEAAREYIGVRIFDVTAYGAVGDGVADDTAEIHLARDAAGVGGEVFFPAGTYLVDGLTASVNDQLWRLHPGATVKMKTGAVRILNITGEGVELVGGVFDGSNGTASDGSQNGVQISAAGVTVRNITVQDSPLYGIAAYNKDQVTITGCTVIDSVGEGIWIQNTLTAPSNVYDIVVTDNFIDNSAGGNSASGIGVHGTSSTQRMNRVTVSRNLIKLPYNQSSVQTGCIGPINCTDVTVDSNQCFGGYISISLVNPANATISNNLVHGWKYVGIELPNGSTNVSVTGNNINPDGVTGTSPAGIQTSDAAVTDISISGNTILGLDAANSSAIKFFTNSGTIKRVLIAGNVIGGACSGLNAIYFVHQVADVSITGNVIDGTSSTSSAGVLFTQAASGVAISGNHFANLTRAAVLFGAGAAVSQDDIRLAGNQYISCGAVILDANYSAGASALGAKVATETTPLISQLKDSNGKAAVNLTATTNAVNYLNVTNAVADARLSGVGVRLQAAGSDADILLQLLPKGNNGFTQIMDGGAATIMRCSQGAGTRVNWFDVQNAPTGSPVRLSAQGTDTNISINLVPKNAGTLQCNGNAVGVKVAVPASAGATGVTGQWAAESGWLYICVAANTWERVAIASW